MSAAVARDAFKALQAPIEIVTAPHTPMPFSPALEDLYIPSAERIAAGVAAAGIPTTLIWGAEDAVMPSTHAGALAGARVEIIAGAGHMVQMENAARVNELIKAQL